MTLQEARDKAWTARKDISVGIDPVKAKKASSNNNSFSAIYKEWYEHKKQVWSVGYATELAKMFDNDILPIIGGLEIQDIEPMQLLEVIRRFEDRGAMERANKACSGQQKLATALEFFQYRFSDSFGGNPPLYSCGLSAL